MERLSGKPTPVLEFPSSNGINKPLDAWQVLDQKITSKTSFRTGKITQEQFNSEQARIKALTEQVEEKGTQKDKDILQLFSRRRPVKLRTPEGSEKNYRDLKSRLQTLSDEEIHTITLSHQQANQHSRRFKDPELFIPQKPESRPLLRHAPQTVIAKLNGTSQT
jgi:hypothetical protein